MSILLIKSFEHPKITLDTFFESTIHSTEKLFFTMNGDPKPMASMMRKDGELITVILDFSSEHYKYESIRAMRDLTKKINAQAFSLMSIAWMTQVKLDDFAQHALLKAVDYKARFMPDRKEILTLYIELKANGTIEKKQHLWDIQDNNLSNPRLEDATDVTGNMVNILEP